MANIKDLGYGVLGITLLVVIVAVIAFGIEIVITIAPFIRIISLVVIALALTTLLLAFSRKTRMITGHGLLIASYALGALVWVDSFVYTYELWGRTAVFIGLFLMGIGVLPMAVLATLFKGQWLVSLLLLFIMAITWGFRIWGATWIEEY